MTAELVGARRPALLGPGRLALLSGGGSVPAPSPPPPSRPPPIAGMDGFTSGIFFPATVYAYAGGGVGQVLGTGFVRGLRGVPVITLTGPDAGGLIYLTGTNGLTLFTGGLTYDTPKSSYSVIINATDGVTTLPPLTVTIVAGRLALMLNSNFILDNAAPADPAAPQIAQYNIDGTWSGAAPTLSDPAAKFLLNTGAQTVVAAAAALPLAASYGAYPVTFSVPNAAGPPATQATTLWVITEKPPLIEFVRSGLALFTDSQTFAAYTQGHAAPGAIVGQIRAYADSGIASISLTSPGNVFGVNTLDQVYLASPPPAGAGQVATITVTSNNGQAADLPLHYDVGVGALLSPTAITATLSAALDNAMTNGVAGTLSVAGMASAAWSIIVQDDECQELIAYGGGAAPRYTIVATGPLTAELHYAYLSAQTDSLLIEASDGAGTIARLVVPLSVAAKVGPSVSVGSAADGSGSGYNYPTWNAVGDAYWSDPAALAGVTITLHPQDYSGDFNRKTLGHGSNQQYFPGPATLRGISAEQRTLVDLKGNAPGLAAQGGLIAQNFDQVFQFLDIRGVTNINSGEGNAGGIYKTNQTPGNLSIFDSALSGCDICVMNGANGNHLRMERTWLAFGGAGAGGLTHNFYAGHFATVTLIDVLSFSTAQVHEAKTRGARNDYTRVVLADGENGVPGASACADFPLGGIVNTRSCTYHKGPNPNNDGNMVQYCPEIGNGGLIEGNWPINTFDSNGDTWLNTCSPHPLNFSSQIVGVGMFGRNGQPYDSLVTGVPATATVTDGRFYNLPRAQWFASVAGGGTVIDGGGNEALLTWPGLLATDPATGRLITNPPGPSYGKYVNSYPGIVIPPLSLELRVAVGAPVDTPVTVATAFDVKGVSLRATTWTITSQRLVQLAGSIGNEVPGTFAIAGVADQGVITTAGAIEDGLYFTLLHVTGIDSLGAAQTYEKWLFEIGGTGYVAAA